MAGTRSNGAGSGKIDTPARLIIADDHDLIRWALKMMLSEELGLEVVGEARDGLESLELCRKLHPHLVLMDLSMPKMGGIEATRNIKVEFPKTIILMITALEDPDYLLEAVRAGAAGYVIKHAERNELLAAVRGVLSGESPLDQGLAMQLLRRLSCEIEERPGSASVRFERREEELLPWPLSPREREVLTLLATGRTNRQIAGELYLSLSTIKGHIERIISKLGVSDRTQAAVKAIELGLIPGRREG